MSSLDIAEIHNQSCAILERLTVTRRASDVALDPATVQEFFRLFQENFGLGDPEISPLALHSTDAKLSQQDYGLLNVGIESKKEKFLVTDAFNPVKTMTGTSQRFGSDRGRGSFIMTSVKGIPNITIKTGSAVVTFIGLPNTVKSESGQGEWVSA